MIVLTALVFAAWFGVLAWRMTFDGSPREDLDTQQTPGWTGIWTLKQTPGGIDRHCGALSRIGRACVQRMAED